MIGHDDAWEAWRAAINGERMHHAWLLTGKAGLGKTAFALGMASHAALEARRPGLFFSLEMSRVVLDKEGVPEDVRALAQRIEAAQAPEITRMQDMLAAWGVTDAQHMDHSGHGGMAGMLTEEQLQDLRDADGPEAARLFLEGMVEHHRGAVDMAQTELEDGENPQARALAEDVIAAQEEEIAQMEDMLAGL